MLCCAVDASLFAASAVSVSAADALKAAGVRQQRRLHQQTVNWRIRLQPALAAANRLPRPQQQQVEASSGTADGWLRTRRQAVQALDALLLALIAVSQRLAADNAQLAGVTPWKDRRTGLAKEDAADSEDGSSDEAEQDADRFASYLRSSFRSFRPRRDELLSRWFERGQQAAGRQTGVASATASAQTAAAGASSLIHRPIAEQIREAAADRRRLRGRTQILRAVHGGIIGRRAIPSLPESQPAAAGAAEAGEAAALRVEQRREEEAFDDLDFYSQLLQELLTSAAGEEAGAGSEGGGEADGRGARAVREMARRSLRAAVDRRASKGRKLRYAVMPRLSNFMAPAAAAASDGRADADVAVDQLVQHLFGGDRSSGALLPAAT